MTLLSTIKADQLQARKNKEALKAALLTTLIGEASVIGKNDGNRETTDDETTKVIQKFLKGINESINYMSQSANGAEALTMLNGEKTILEAYLPKQLTVEQIKYGISTQIQSGALKKDPSLKGAAMKYLKENFSGQYDGKTASQAIDEILKS